MEYTKKSATIECKLKEKELDHQEKVVEEFYRATPKLNNKRGYDLKPSEHYFGQDFTNH